MKIGSSTSENTCPRQDYREPSLSLAYENRSILTTRARCLSDLEPYREAWNALAAKAPMRSPEWLLGWWSYYARPHDELYLLLFLDATGALVGLAPLYLEVKGRQRTVRLLGSGEVSTNHTSWLSASGSEGEISVAVARFLLDMRSDWNALRFDASDGSDRAIDATVRYLAEKGYLVHRTPLQKCWEIALPPSWEAYLSMLSKTHRKRCRKLYQQYFASGLVEVHQATTEANLQRGFEILLSLHAARWGEAKRPMGCFSDLRFRRFHENVAREMLSRKQLLLVWLEFEGIPIAAEYQFMDEHTVYSYLAGMDTTVSELPPGNLSLMASIRLAIQQGCRTFDLSRGNQPYKAHWRAVPVDGYDIRIWPGDLSGRVKCSLRVIRDSAERGRLSAVRWLKARIPAYYVGAWRQLVYRIGGRRFGPRKMSACKHEPSND